MEDSPNNEAKARARLDAILIYTMDDARVWDMQTGRKLSLQSEFSLEATVKNYCIVGRADYTIWYRKAKDTVNNAVVVEAKAKKELERDIRALQITESIVETPYLLEHAILRQDDIHEYPGGYIRTIVMSKMPGKPADEYDGLTTNERSLIKRKVTRILESMRLAGWKMSEGYPELVVYDRSTGDV
ncbi:uncharacterized protein LDX57_005136 [Aspergillus melleus]|uniref:uncharacterized protein n=1 Tax=Aspergillus melleus TaxID=138277 RepID=UPI001E8D85FC|nr:uncharacterized protein LDX57_005136 [Aspergillus melleus]KAH8427421.1 hypothetical protein LDX57_005136 [Aspergillus melleus]